MEAVLLVAILLIPLVMLIVPGVLLVREGIRRRRPQPDDPVPAAQVVVGERSPIRRGGRSKRRALGRAASVSVGSALIGAGGFVIWAIIDIARNGLGLGDMTKGRLLRLRGKAQLPEVATGGGWSDDAVPSLDGLTPAERRTLADAWLLSARMEHASIPAFAQLSLHLAALGAPSELVERTHRAALDELRHARRCFALASAYGGASWTAGPIAALATRDRGDAIDPVRLAIGSLVDGCLNEGIAADIAARGARGAEDPVVRATLAMIAADEEQHAELGWAVLAWCIDVGGDAVRAAVSARAGRLAEELAPRAPDFAGVDRARLATHGLFDQDVLGAIASARVARVQARAFELAAPVRVAA